jgi:hypothetical protein
LHNDPAGSEKADRVADVAGSAILLSRSFFSAKLKFSPRDDSRDTVKT